MNSITEKNRRSSNEKLDRDLRRSQILDVFRTDGPTLTARQITRQMAKKGLIPEFDMNYVKPRLTEMMQEGILKVVNKQKDEVSGKSVSVYEQTHAHFRNHENGQIGMDLWRMS